MTKASLLVATLALAVCAAPPCGGAEAASVGQPPSPSKSPPAREPAAAPKPALAPVAATVAPPATGNAATGAAQPDPNALPMEANKETPPSDDMTASRNAARTRMRECGHQWSGMKKSGAAGGLTWKDFSQSCLARK